MLYAVLVGCNVRQHAVEAVYNAGAVKTGLRQHAVEKGQNSVSC